MICGQCGTQVEKGARFCKNCGTQLKENSNTQPMGGIPVYPVQKAQNVSLNTTKTNKYIKPAVLFGGILIAAVIMIEAVKSLTSGGKDFYGGDYDSSYAQFDPNLCGRWRSYDGGTLAFSDDGFITSCDFKCWSIRDDKPDYITWYAENGRVTCKACFDNNFAYKINYSDLDGAELLTLKDGKDAEYKRTAGKEGDGLIGTWTSVWGEMWTFQFNADGSGMQNGKFPLSWYVNGSNNTIYLTLLDKTHFDYSVSGNILTVFLKDGSRIYTRVGD